MMKPPDKAEWDTSQLSPERSYLNAGLSFEEIASRVVTTVQMLRVLVKPYETPEHGEPKNARQVAFLSRADPQACDLLFNAPDGLRGRYWQSPDHGFLATKHLIGELMPALKRFAMAEPPGPCTEAAEMTIADIVASLAAPSAKVWPREFDDDRNWLLKADKLTIRRWAENEMQAEAHLAFWRRSQVTDELDIKGAILGANGTEYIPAHKRYRSYQIFKFGFT
ncbi:hypothetical protein AB7M49_006619 [Bradyrhizobium elkanii]